MNNSIKISGYSLIELIAVIVVVSVIAGIALKSLKSASDTSRTERTKKELDQLAFAVAGDPNVSSGGTRTDYGYIGDVGGMPPNLDALVANPGGYGTWKGPYLHDDYLLSSGSSNTEFKVDEWGVNYAYSAGNTIASTGGGSTITRKVANSVSDLIYNSVAVTVTDVNHVPPGATNKDSVRIILTHPNGSGGITTKTRYPANDGFVRIDSVPIGQHTLRVVFLPQNDTLTRKVAVNPGELSTVNVNLFRAAWTSASGGGGGSGGPLSVVIRPNGSGSYTEHDNSGCSNNWQCVDDVTSDGDATYVEAPGSSTYEDSYSAENPTGSGTIDSVIIYIKVKNTATNNQIANTFIRTGGSSYFGSDINLNSVSAYTDFSTTYTNNPNTSSAWQWSEINSIEIGVRIKKPARCTQVWAVIFYTP